MISGKHDEELRSCKDCKFAQAAISWWCVNDDAVKQRGTAYTGKHNCQHWQPCDHIKDRKRGFFGSVKVDWYDIEIKGIEEDNES